MNDKSSDIGSYLQNHRRAQNIPLEAVSRATRIGMANLRRIENEEWDDLPAPVFVRGFLRAFAEAIGTDPEEALRRYDLSFKAGGQHSRTGIQAQSGARFWLRFVLAAFCLAVVIGGTIVAANRIDRSKEEPEASEARGGGESANASGGSGENADPAANPGKQAPAPEPSNQDRQAMTARKELTLLVSAVDATRLKVIADARKPEQFDLKAGDELTLKAEAHFSLLIDNVAGIRLMFNGAPIDLPNKSGQTLTLQLP